MPAQLSASASVPVTVPTLAVSLADSISDSIGSESPNVPYTPVAISVHLIMSCSLMARVANS